jgi:hypothetical protein
MHHHACTPERSCACHENMFAHKHCRGVLAYEPSNYEATKELGRLYVNRAQDPETYQKGVDLLKKALKVCRAFSAPCASSRVCPTENGKHETSRIRYPGSIDAFYSSLRVLSRAASMNMKTISGVGKSVTFCMHASLCSVVPRAVCGSTSSRLIYCRALIACKPKPVAYMQVNPLDDEVWSSLHKYTRNPHGEIREKKRQRKYSSELQGMGEDKPQDLLVSSPAAVAAAAAPAS